MSLPLRVMPREAQGQELEAHTRDLSYQGLYFLAQDGFEVGSDIEFILTLPQQMTQSGDVNIRCQGRWGKPCITMTHASPWRNCRRTRCFRIP